VTVQGQKTDARSVMDGKWASGCKGEEWRSCGAEFRKLTPRRPGSKKHPSDRYR
jgi:hypothetical protein